MLTSWRISPKWSLKDLMDSKFSHALEITIPILKMSLKWPLQERTKLSKNGHQLGINLLKMKNKLKPGETGDISHFRLKIAKVRYLELLKLKLSPWTLIFATNSTGPPSWTSKIQETCLNGSKKNYLPSRKLVDKPLCFLMFQTLTSATDNMEEDIMLLWTDSKLLSDLVFMLTFIKSNTKLSETWSKRNQSVSTSFSDQELPTPVNHQVSTLLTLTQKLLSQFNSKPSLSTSSTPTSSMNQNGISSLITKKDYNLPDLSPQSFMDHSMRIYNDANAAKQYRENRYVKGPMG